MPKDKNVNGQVVTFLRNQRGWSQNDLVTKLHLLGASNMTREQTANIETPRSAVDSKQIEFLAEVFGIREQALFPMLPHRI